MTFSPASDLVLLQRLTVTTHRQTAGPHGDRSTIPNAVITKIGTDGRVCLYTHSPTHLIADVNGYFPAP